MFVSKKFHQAQVAFLTSQLEKIASMSSEHQSSLKDVYESRILNLELQISKMEKLVFPSYIKETVHPTLHEFDSAIGVSEKPPEVSERDHNDAIEGRSEGSGSLRELDLILSGNYDLDLGSINE